MSTTQGPQPQEPLSPHRTVATAAGVYDWFLRGRHHLPCDAAAAINTQRSFPMAAKTALYNRQFLQRAVRYLAGEGVRQFLDIGSGYPAVGNVHEIAQEAAPGSRVVYVDYDPDTVNVGRTILAGNPDAIAVRGDLRDPDGILGDPEVTGLLDFAEPVGLLMIAVLHFIEDAQPLVGRYLESLAPGSHLVISHGTQPPDDRILAIQDELVAVYNHTVNESIVTRSRDQTAALFAPASLVPPGVVLATSWRSEDPDYQPDDDDEASVVLLGGVARVG
jgi:SAM-dependent methyltransferase